MPTMPNVQGQQLYSAQASLQSSGVLVPTALGYFTTWPITVSWKPSATIPGTVTAQSPAAGNTVAANSAVSLTVSEPKTSVAYP